MEKKIDACGLSCPQPVLLVVKALDSGFLPVTVTVDNPTARENIRRMAQARKYTVTIEEDGENEVLTITGA